MQRRPHRRFLLAGIPERDVEDAFSRYGRLSSCWLARKPPGFGFGERRPHRNSGSWPVIPT
jgi:hypothetical protein